MDMKQIKIGTATLIHGDCVEFMRDLPDKSFSLACVDPQYGIGMDRGMKGSRGIDKRNGKAIQRRDYVGGWDNERPGKEYFFELIRSANLQLIWGGNFFADLLPASTHWIFWDKKNPMPTFGDGELCYTSSTRKSITRFVLPYWGHQTAGELDRTHPTQKPVKLYEWIYANYAKPGQTILDTHGGSMSSVIAALNMGFEITCIEKDEDYFNAAVERVIKSQQQQKLF